MGVGIAEPALVRDGTGVPRISIPSGQTMRAGCADQLIHTRSCRAVPLQFSFLNLFLNTFHCYLFPGRDSKGRFEFRPELHHLPAVCPWANDLAFLSLHCLIYKIGIKFRNTYLTGKSRDVKSTVLSIRQALNDSPKAGEANWGEPWPKY